MKGRRYVNTRSLVSPIVNTLSIRFVIPVQRSIVCVVQSLAPCTWKADDVARHLVVRFPETKLNNLVRELLEHQHFVRLLWDQYITLREFRSLNPSMGLAYTLIIYFGPSRHAIGLAVARNCELLRNMRKDDLRMFRSQETFKWFF